MKLSEINLNKKISSQLAFLILIVLSSLVALFTLRAAEEIIASAKTSDSFNIQNRIGAELAE